ncbi:CAP domain-containing protein [uncultured Clostridium sp.]|uniref:CAP domain-containing protein n=1 Tax=uncultured Clostridium sp. TaxID=59620 RepID=UPI003218011C
MKKKFITLIICGALAGTALVGLTLQNNMESENNSKDINKASIESLDKKEDTIEKDNTEIDSSNVLDGKGTRLSRGGGQAENSQNDKNVVTNDEGSSLEEKENSKTTVNNQEEITEGTPYSNTEKPSVPSQETVNVPSKSTTTPTTTDTGDFSSQIEQLIFTKVNEERARAGMSTLSYSSLMEKYARIKSKDMGDRNYFDHKNLEGELITSQMARDGISYRAWGENLAYIGGVSDINELANQFMINWMNSQGHRENILSPDYTSIGVGVYKAGNRYYATQEFYK